jgi:DNA replication protein DnaC
MSAHMDAPPAVLPTCWGCKTPILENVITCRHRPTGRQATWHFDCFELMKRRTFEVAEEHERFARARVAGFLAGLPEFSVRHDSAEFTKRVTHQRLRGAAERYSIELGNVAFVAPSGLGKSMTMAAIGYRLTEEAVTAYRVSAGRDSQKIEFAARMLWTTAAALCVARKHHRLGEGEAPEVERAERAPLLFLDEIGQEIADDRWLLEFLNVRYTRQLTTLTTSGLTTEELERRYGMGTKRRLVEPRGIFLDLFEQR